MRLKLIGLELNKVISEHSKALEWVLEEVKDKEQPEEKENVNGI